MKIKLILTIIMTALLSVQVFSQAKTGTLKVFSEMTGISVLLDEVKQNSYQEIKNIPIGTHYLKVTDSRGEKVYGNIVTINENSVTTVLVDAPKDASGAQTKVTDTSGEKKPAPDKQVQTGAKTGNLTIFSELNGISVYLDENKQGDDIKQVQGVPIGNHYLKVLKDGVSIFGELVTINEGQTTTVLIKNTGQVAEKIMDSKVKEREEYNKSKVDILFTSNAITQTKGSSTLFPGYYGYWGYSNSVSSTTQVSDFKVVQGGVKEIGDLSLARLAGNQNILDRNARDNTKMKKMANIGAPLLLVGTLVSLLYLGDFMLKKPFLHKSPTHPDYEVYMATGAILTGIAGYVVLNGSEKAIPRHYYNVDDAAKDAQDYNKKLKQKLGLPESYDTGK